MNSDGFSENHAIAPAAMAWVVASLAAWDACPAVGAGMLGLVVGAAASCTREAVRELRASREPPVPCLPEPVWTGEGGQPSPVHTMCPFHELQALGACQPQGDAVGTAAGRDGS